MKAVDKLPFDQYVNFLVSRLRSQSPETISKEQIFESLRFVSALDNKGIRPDVMTGLLSPNSEPGKKIKVPQNVVSLTGPSGILPTFYNDYLARMKREKNTSLADFLDVFVHHLAKIYLKIEDRQRILPQENKKGLFAEFISTMANANSADGKIAGAGLMSGGIESLCADLGHQFDADVSLTQFHGAFKPLPVDYRFRLGRVDISII